MNSATNGKIGLWWLCMPIGVWMLHFLTAYVVAAVHCAQRSESFAPLDGVRLTILAVTVGALLSFAALARVGQRRRRGDPVSAERPADRAQNRFLGTLLMLLCGLSAVATLAVAAVGLVFADCRQ